MSRRLNHQFIEKAKILERALQHAYNKNLIRLCESAKSDKELFNTIEIMTPIPLKQLIDRGLERFVVIKTINLFQITGQTIDEIPVIIYYENSRSN